MHDNMVGKGGSVYSAVWWSLHLTSQLCGWLLFLNLASTFIAIYMIMMTTAMMITIVLRHEIRRKFEYVTTALVRMTRRSLQVNLRLSMKPETRCAKT